MITDTLSQETERGLVEPLDATAPAPLTNVQGPKDGLLYALPILGSRQTPSMMARVSRPRTSA